MEVVVFDIGGFIFGTEVSQIISIVKTSEEMEWMDESVSLVDVSAELGTAAGYAFSEERATRRVHAFQKEAMVLLVQASPPVQTGGTTGKASSFAWRVDRLRGIMRIPLEQIDPLPEFLKSRMQTDCIWGIGKLEQELVILLDLDLFAQKLSEKSISHGSRVAEYEDR